MSALHVLSLDERLERFSVGLTARAPGRFAALSILLGEGARWGIGLRSDAALPIGGTVRLIHWIVSPYSDVPDGIVEDCQSARLRLVFGAEGASLRFAPDGPLLSLPPDRANRRNLLSGSGLMGLRGWDIPHDRHMAVTDLSSGAADITGTNLADAWRDSWSLSVVHGAETMEVPIASTRARSG